MIYRFDIIFKDNTDMAIIDEAIAVGAKNYPESLCRVNDYHYYFAGKHVEVPLDALGGIACTLDCHPYVKEAYFTDDDDIHSCLHNVLIFSKKYGLL